MCKNRNACCLELLSATFACKIRKREQEPSFPMACRARSFLPKITRAREVQAGATLSHSHRARNGAKPFCIDTQLWIWAERRQKKAQLSERRDKNNRQKGQTEEQESECPANTLDTKILAFTTGAGAGMSHFAVSFVLFSRA